MRCGYSSDLAYIHDTGFGDFARSAAPRLLAILRGARIRRGFVMDLGCGSGILASELSRAGYEVLGVDLSRPMLALARKRAPRAQFVRGSLLRVKLPPCDAVVSIGECLNYTFDRNSDRTLARLFERVYAALRPGGVFAFDIAGPGQISAALPARRWLQGGDWAILLDRSEDKRRLTFTRRMTIFRKVGRLYRRSEEMHRIRLLKATNIRRQLARAGFAVRTLPSFGKTVLAPGYVAFVATKPSAGRSAGRAQSPRGAGTAKK